MKLRGTAVLLTLLLGVAIVAGCRLPASAAGEKQPGKAPLKTALVLDDRYRDHRTRAGHPESPARYDAAVKGVTNTVPAERLLILAPRAATEDEIERCHPKAYIETVRRDVAAGRGWLSTGDTDIGPASFDVALLAAGGVLTAIDAVMAGKARNAFCPVRPPGHHATRDRGMGFCIFNNVAIAARHLQQKHALKRILIVDWDVHHGNGIQEIFYGDARVFYFSIHQWPFYPGTGLPNETGAGKGEGTTMNCPMPSGAGHETVVKLFREKLAPAMAEFKPEFVLVSAGFDAREGDPIGSCRLTDETYAELTRIVMAIADQHAQGRIVSALEGGYNLTGLASAAAAHVEVLAGVGD